MVTQQNNLKNKQKKGNGLLYDQNWKGNSVFAWPQEVCFQLLESNKISSKSAINTISMRRVQYWQIQCDSNHSFLLQNYCMADGMAA